jgi:hypothetical protein
LRTILDGNFLEFGGLLAADAVAGLEGYNVAGGAEITHFKKLAVMNGEEPMNLERAIRLGDSFQPHLEAVQAFILHGVKKVGSIGGKSLLPVADLKQGTITSGG